MPEANVYEIAICFSRMWGIAETLEPLPNKSFQTVRDIVMEWAEEFAANEEQDYVSFFVRKMKSIVW